VRFTIRTTSSFRPTLIVAGRISAAVVARDARSRWMQPASSVVAEFYARSFTAIPSPGATFVPFETAERLCECVHRR